MKTGFNDHRLNRNDAYNEKEVAFADAINEELKHNSMFLNQIVNSREIIYLSDHEEKIVLSVIQWLGTPVGQGFLEKVNKLV